MKEILELINGELDFANTKHPFWPEDSVHASAIINEEAGKLTQACIDHENGDSPYFPGKERMRKKAVSTAAMAIRFLQDFDNY